MRKGFREINEEKQGQREVAMLEWIRGAWMDGSNLCQAADKLGVAQIALVS